MFKLCLLLSTGLSTSEASFFFGSRTDLINKQTFTNGHRKLQKIKSENGYFKSEYNLLVTKS